MQRRDDWLSLSLLAVLLSSEHPLTSAVGPLAAGLHRRIRHRLRLTAHMSRGRSWARGLRARLGPGRAAPPPIFAGRPGGAD